MILLPTIVYQSTKPKIDPLQGSLKPKHLGRFLREEFLKKNISDEYLMEKLEISQEDLEAIKHSPQGEQILPSGKKLDNYMLRKISGIIGIGYRRLLSIAKYKRSRNHINQFWTENGEMIDEEEILLKIYYENPKEFLPKLQSLLKG